MLNKKELVMKKVFSLAVFVVVSLVFFSSTTYGQEKMDFGQKLKFQLHKFLNGDSDGAGCDEALKVRKRLKTQEGSGECNGFVDEDGDGVCDNCGGTGDCDRDRLKDGEGLKKRGGN
jgi:hypothetical protein